jgi:response regulator NasT
MKQSLRIIVADDEPLLAEELSAYLRDMGNDVVAVASTGKELVDMSAELQPDLIVTDIKMPDMDGLEAAKEICLTTPIPIVVVSAYHDEEYINRATEQCVMSYLVKPIDEASLKTSLALAMRRFREFEALHNENASLRQTLEDRKLIERAKGVLMKRTRLDEEAAFLRLQKLSREKASRMVDVARTILDAEQAFDV